jgi:ribosomal protein S18 acetylase RimI-like enzyme
MKGPHATGSEDIMTLHIRRIIQEDHTAIVETAKALHQWFTELGVQQIAKDLQTQKGLVALEDESTAGFVTYVITVDEKVAELTWIAVHPEFHRKGIGRCLVKALEKVLVKLGVSALEVSTVADSVEYEPYARTRSFYHALGFSDVRVDRKWYPSGDDRLLLRKPLTKRTAQDEHD